MNRFLEQKWSMYAGSHGMRDELLDTLSDADLAFTPGGSAMPLGALIRQMGEIEYAYVQSLKTLKQDWNYHNSEPGLDASLSKLKAWLQTLDAEMQTVVEGLTDADLDQEVERESGYKMSREVQLDVYLQALLIFFGKLSIYVRALDKPLTPAFTDWIW